MLVLAYETTKRARKVFVVLFCCALSPHSPSPSPIPLSKSAPTCLLACLVIVYPVPCRRENHFVCNFFPVFVSDFDCSSLVAPLGQRVSQSVRHVIRTPRSTANCNWSAFLSSPYSLRFAKRLPNSRSALSEATCHIQVATTTRVSRMHEHENIFSARTSYVSSTCLPPLLPLPTLFSPFPLPLM